MWRDGWHDQGSGSFSTKLKRHATVRTNVDNPVKEQGSVFLPPLSSFSRIQLLAAEVSVSNRTFVCFECRTTERVPLARLTRNCRRCRAQAEHVFYKFRIPAADDDRAWADLKQRVREVNDQMKARALRHLHAKADRYIRNLTSARGERKARLRRELGAIQDRIAQWEQWP